MGALGKPGTLLGLLCFLGILVEDQLITDACVLFLGFLIYSISLYVYAYASTILLRLQ